MRNLLALLASVTFSIVAASAAERTQINLSAQKVIAENLPKLKAKRTKLDEKIRLVRALGELGPDAAPAVPFLLSNSFFYEQGGRTAKDHPLRLATIDALVKIGEPAVPEVVKLLSQGQRQGEPQHQVRLEVVGRRDTAADGPDGIRRRRHRCSRERDAVSKAEEPLL